MQADKQSCKKLLTRNDVDTAFEARDLEDEVDIEDLGLKINNIEKVTTEFKGKNTAQ